MRNKNQPNAVFEFKLVSSTGYKSEGSYDNVSPNQYRQVIGALEGTLRESAEGFFDLIAHLRHQREWSERTFGPGKRVNGVTDHIAKELIEVRESDGDLKEWVDVIILGMDGAWRSGATPEQIVEAIVAKQTKNEGRTWPDWRTAPPDTAIEHDRSQEAPVPAIVFFPCGSLGESVESEGGEA